VVFFQLLELVILEIQFPVSPLAPVAHVSHFRAGLAFSIVTLVESSLVNTISSPLNQACTMLAPVSPLGQVFPVSPLGH